MRWVSCFALDFLEKRPIGGVAKICQESLNLSPGEVCVHDRLLIKASGDFIERESRLGPANVVRLDGALHGCKQLDEVGLFSLIDL